jgi:hypothetical protein
VRAAQAAVSTAPAFEVASIKPSGPIDPPRALFFEVLSVFVYQPELRLKSGS